MTLKDIAVWHLNMADLERDVDLAAFHREAADLLEHRALPFPMPGVRVYCFYDGTVDPRKPPKQWVPLTEEMIAAWT